MQVEMLEVAAAPSVQVSDTVLDAVRTMERFDVGAVGVLEEDRLVGIFTERDLMFRVVLLEKSVTETTVAQVLSGDLETVQQDSDCGQALDMMLAKKVRHLPVVDENGSLVRIINIRELVRAQVEELADSLRSVMAYFTADGPGG